MKSIYHIHKNEDTGVFYVHNTSTGETVQLVAALNIADLEAADLPLSGLEKAQVVQNGENKSVRVAHIVELVPVPSLRSVLVSDNNADGNIISGLGGPDSDQDAATKIYVDEKIGAVGIDDVLSKNQALSDERSINVQENRTFKIVSDECPDGVFRIDPSNRFYSLGDFAEGHNGTRIDIDDGNKRIYLRYQERLTAVGAVALPGIKQYANNAAALADGLSVNDLYYTNVAGDGVLKIVL